MGMLSSDLGLGVALYNTRMYCYFSTISKGSGGIEGVYHFNYRQLSLNKTSYSNYQCCTSPFLRNKVNFKSNIGTNTCIDWRDLSAW